MASYWLTKLLDVIAPRFCAICDDRLSFTESLLCARCHLHLPYTHFETTPYDNRVARLFWGLFPVERVVSAFYFYPHSESSQMIYKLKYGGQPEIGQKLGIIMGRRLCEKGFFDGIDAIIPVPLTRRRLWQRGYNQSMEIARGLREVTGLPIWNKVVRRSKFSASQTGMRGWERRANVAGNFVLRDGERIKGRHVLLVDDIITTGSTITSCALALSQAGDVRISIFSIGFTT